MINDDSADIWIDPIYFPIDRSINTSKLYARPGKFIEIQTPEELKFDKDLDEALRKEKEEK